MLLIPCPWCGQRAEIEFRCAGQVKPPRGDMLDSDDQMWLEYLYRVDNYQGVLEEYWCHEKGCGEWFKLKRHTVTHKFIDSDEDQ